MKTSLLWLALLFAGVPLVAGSGVPPVVTLSSWSYREHFADGLTGWMSFPLAQDVGFDPTLYTQCEGLRTVLIRQVQPLGRKRLLLGVNRPLDFFADRATRIQFEYGLRLKGRIAGMEIVLAGANGRRYSFGLPRGPGIHSVTVSGSELRLPPKPIRMQAVILVARIDGPPPRAEERLTIRRFEIHAERPSTVTVLSPVLERSETGEEIVAGQVLSPASRLNLRIQSTAEPTVVELVGPGGRRAQKLSVPAARTAISVPLGTDPAPGLWKAKIRSGSSETDFSFLVLGRTRPHPRILLQRKRLAELRKLPQYAGLRRQIHREARQLAGAIAYNPAAGANIAHLPVGTGLHPDFVGEVKPYFKLLESYSNAIAYNALDYSLNGNRASLGAARRALLTVAKWETWTPPRYTSHGEHTYYEVGIFAQRVAFGYDLIAPELTAEEKRVIADAFWRQVIKPTVDEYYIDDRMPLAASNWMANSLGGAMAAAVATEGDVPGWGSREGVALAELTRAYERLLKGLFPGDGSEAEPAGYEDFAMKGLSYSAAALHALGIQVPGTRRMWEGFWWPYYAMVRPDMVLDTGDFDGKLESLSGFAWGAERAGIPALREFYDRGKARVVFSPMPGIKHTGRAVEQEVGPIGLACCTQKPPTNFAAPPPSRIFPRRGSAVLRSGWSPRSTVISIRVGAWFNHEHHDEGSFQVAAFGQKLVAEAGYSAYYNDPNYPVYFIQAPGHNTVLLDGNPFSQSYFNGRYWAAFHRYPHFTSHLLSSAFDYLAADLTSAYAGRLSDYQRDFVFIKPDILVVRDRITAPRPYVFAWLLHAPAGARLGLTGNRATIRTAGATASMLAAGPSSLWKVRATPIPITKFDNLDQGVIHTPHEFYLTSVRSPSVGFLVGMRFAAGGAATRGATLEQLKSASGEGIIEEGRVSLGVIFRTHPGELQLKRYATDGSVLAVKGVAAQASVLAVGARTVDQSGKAVFLSKAPVNVAWRRKTMGIELTLNAPTETRIEIAAPKSPARVTLDGRPVRFEFRGGMAELQGIEKGEHRVIIDY